MRLGPALLVALLPLLARTDFASTSNEDDTFHYSLAPAASSNSVQFTASKPPSSTSKTSTASNTIPVKPTKYKKDIYGYAWKNGSAYGFGKRKEEIPVQHLASPYSTKRLQTESLKAPLTKRKNLTVGYLTAAKGELKERQGLAVSGALTMALEEVSFVEKQIS